MDHLDNIKTLILHPIAIFLLALGVVYFLFGVLQFVTAGGNEEQRKTGTQHMIYGVIGLFIMVSVWGILNLIMRTIEGLK